MIPRSIAGVLIVCASMFGCLQDAIVARGRDAQTDAVDGERRERSALKVEGEVVASLGTDGVSGDTQVRFAVRVTRSGESTTAQVFVESTLGTVELSERDGQYVGSQSEYATRYALRVVMDGVEVRSAFVGPAAHSITQPAARSMVTANTALAVAWAPTGATEATVETEDFAETPVRDTGAFSVPASAIVGEAGRESDDRVRVRRTDTVTLPEFAEESRVRVSVVRENRFTVTAL